MKFSGFIKRLLITFTLFISLNSQAGIITFNFEEDLSDDQHSISYISDYFTLTVEAFNPNGSNGDISRWIDGLGVSTNPDSNRLGLNEYITFTLEGASFDMITLLFPTNAGGNKNALGGLDVANISFDDGNNESFSGYTTSWTSQKVDASSFTIRASGNGNGFRVREVQFDVPEPTTLAIFALGLIGLASRRLKKQ